MRNEVQVSAELTSRPPLPAVSPALPRSRRRAFWIRQTVLWHWTSSAMCLGAMLLFTVTGITLNHAAQIPSTPVVEKKTVVLPAHLLKALGQSAEGKRPLPGAVATWIAGQFPEKNLEDSAEWSATEVYLSLPRPGGDGWLTIDRETGEVVWERTERGWIAYLNDLHKGRHTGWVWQAFIDIIAVAFLVFTATGLVLLQIHSAKRPATWPVIAVGFAAPVVLLAFLMHF